ncbi:MAG: glycosyltransferase, partial [Ilumatobacteraceae bacterium]
MTQTDQPDRLTVLTDSRQSYPDILEGLVSDHDAVIVELDPAHDGHRVLSKRQYMTRIIRPAALRNIRAAMRPGALLVVFGWYSLPVLAMQRMHLAPRPQSIVFVAVFAHNQRIEQIVFRLLRSLGSRRWRAVAFSEGDRTKLVERNVFLESQVIGVVYRREHDLVPLLDAGSATPADSVPFVFTAGYSHRDYATFSTAVAAAPWSVHMVISESNRADVTVGPEVVVEFDVPWDRYEDLLRRSAVVAIPLLPGGGACGQSVMLSAMKYSRPVVATAHPSIEAYVGSDYPGLVPPSDPDALREAV